MEKKMATYSSTFAWKIPWTEEPGRLHSMGSLESDTTEQLYFHFSLSCIGEGNCNPLQCSCLENPRDGGAWWAVVYGVVQSQTRLKRLSNFGLKPKSCKAGMLFSHSVVSNSLRHHGLQHTSLPCPLLSPWVCWNSCPLSQRRHPIISFSVAPFSFCSQSLPTSGSFPMSQLFRWPKYQSFSFSISSSNAYSGLISFRIDWFDILIVQRTLRSLLQHHISKASNLWRSAFFMDQLSHLYMTTGKQTRDNQIVKLSN